jgi:hypothetical protein
MRRMRRAAAQFVRRTDIGRRKLAHLAAFDAGLVLALGLNLPATFVVATHNAPAAAWRVRFVSLTVVAFATFLLSAAMATVAVFAGLSDLTRRGVYGLGDRYLGTALVGFAHGVLGVWPFFLLSAWAQSVGVVQMSLGAAFVFQAAALLWFGATCIACGMIVPRLARVGEPGATLCPHCSYDLRTGHDRCPECGRP